LLAEDCLRPCQAGVKAKVVELLPTVLGRMTDAEQAVGSSERSYQPQADEIELNQFGCSNQKAER